MKRIEKILISGVINTLTYPAYLYDITHQRFFTFRGRDDKGEYILIANIAEEISEKNAIVNGKKCAVFDCNLYDADYKLVEHLD